MNLLFVEMEKKTIKKVTHHIRVTILQLRHDKLGIPCTYHNSSCAKIGKNSFVKTITEVHIFFNTIKRKSGL